MSVIRQELVNDAYEKAFALTDYHDNVDKQHEFRVQFILADESLTNDEKSEAIRFLNENYDKDKINTSLNALSACSKRSANALHNCFVRARIFWHCFFSTQNSPVQQRQV